MFNILHATLKLSPKEEEKIKQAIRDFTLIRQEVYNASFEYGKIYDEKEEKVLDTSKTNKIERKDGKGFIKSESYAERVVKEKFDNKFGKNFVHSAFRDFRKIKRRFKDKKNLISNNQLYFEADKKNLNLLCEINNENDIIINLQNPIKGKINFFNLKKHPNFSFNNPFGLRIIQRLNNKKNKSKWNDKFHIQIDYDDGLKMKKVDFSNGCVGIDQNQENISLTEIDNNSNLVRFKKFIFENIVGNKMATIKDEEKEQSLIRVLKKVMKYCLKVNKPLVVEFLADGTINNGKSFKKKSRKYNKSLCRFPRGMFQKNVERQAIYYGVPLIAVYANYTSRIGMIKHLPNLKKENKFIEECHSAAYTIARRGLFLGENYISRTNWKNACKLKKEEFIENYKDRENSKELGTEDFMKWKIEQKLLEQKSLEKEKPVILYNKTKINEDISFEIAKKMIDNNDFYIKFYNPKYKDKDYTKKIKDPLNIYRVLYRGSGAKNGLTKNCRTIVGFFEYLRKGKINQTLLKSIKKKEGEFKSFIGKYNIEKEEDIVKYIDKMYECELLTRKK